MPSSTSASLRLELIASGEKANTWGTITNTNLGTLLEEAICGYKAVTVSNSVDTTLTPSNWVSDEARNAVIHLTGTITATRNVIAPQAPKVYIVKNGTSGEQSIIFKRSGSTGVTIPNGKTVILFYNGTTTDFEVITPYFAETSTTAVNLYGGTNWVTAGRTNSVANMLGWKNFGDGHVIFDASAGTSPSGVAVNNTNPTTAWTATYPTLMGWNGSSTYGVRVDNAATASGANTTFDIKYGTTPSAQFSVGSTSTLNLLVGNQTGAFYFTQIGELDILGASSKVFCQGSIQTSGSLTCINNAGGTHGIGYTGTGTGGTVTQATSKTTAVTLNKICGTITTSTASLAANTAVSFSFVNSTIASTDNLILNIVGGTNGAYCLGMDAITNGSCTITLRNLTAGAIAEAVSIRFTVLKAVNA